MKVIAIMVVMVLLIGSPMAFAGKSEDPVTGAVKTVGRAAQGTVETAVSPVKAITEGKTPDHVVTDPVVEGGKTVGKAAENTGKSITCQEVE